MITVTNKELKVTGTVPLLFNSFMSVKLLLDFCQDTAVGGRKRNDIFSIIYQSYLGNMWELVSAFTGGTFH